MARRALQVAAARQVLLGKCYLADADGKTGPFCHISQDSRKRLLFWISEFRDVIREKITSRRSAVGTETLPPSLCGWVTVLELPPAENKPRRQLWSSVLPLDGTRRPRGTGQHVHIQGPHPVLCPSRGRAPGSYRQDQEGQVSNWRKPSRRKTEGMPPRALSACPCWRHLRTQRLPHLAIRLLRSNKWQTVRLVSLPLFLILKERAHDVVGKGRKNSTWIFLFFKYRKYSTFRDFLSQKFFSKQKFRLTVLRLD